MIGSWFSSRPVSLQWAALVLGAGMLGELFRMISLPAAFFLGPMFAGIAFGVMGSATIIPVRAYQFSIGLVGALVGHSVKAGVLASLVQEWPFMLAATMLTVLLSLLTGLLLTWLGDLAASSALWGTAPGAAPIMMSMSENDGADSRLVATMQYVRLICVIAISALISHQLAGSAEIVQPISEEPVTSGYWLNVSLSLVLVVVGVVIGLRVPAGVMLCPLIFAVVLQLTGILTIKLPEPLMELAYATIGCYVGLRFDRRTLLYVMRKLPIMLAAALVLITLCGLSAWLFAVMLERDYLSAFLATSPGGLDSLSIIAIESHCDVGLVVAMQTLRLFAVVLLTPPLVKICLRTLESIRDSR